MEVEGTRKTAVSFQQVHTSYGIGRLKNQVLKDVSLNVQEGTIFGLLGPSGCGKTTVLKCVVDRLKPDRGTVKVFNHNPGSAASKIPGSGVGYMPQELALYPNLTIDETMHFFGRLHYMKTQDVKSRIAFLFEFLNLPRSKKLVINYSGGERRRVSFAIALLHQPPLLILDEPTVGVDAILRKSIWNYLVKISLNENVTVIITTHYIEEARRANKIALMRGGCILAQDEPDSLINQHNAASLEDVFLQLCEKESTNVVSENTNVAFVEPQLQSGSSITSQEKNSDRQRRLPNCKDNLKLPSFRRIKALIILNYIKLWRNYMLVLFQFLSPVLQVLVIYWSIGTQPKNLNVAVFNQDKILGPKYLHHINNETIHQIAVDSTANGEDLVRDGKAWAVITILPNFTTALLTRLTSLNSSSNDTLGAGTVFVSHDNTDQLITFSLQEALYTAFNDFAKDAIHEFDKPMTRQLPTIPVQVKKFKVRNYDLQTNPTSTAVTERKHNVVLSHCAATILSPILISFGEPIYGQAKASFIEYLTPGMLVCFPFFLALSLTAVSFVTDKMEGLLERVYVSGASSFEVLCGHICTQSGVILIQVGVMLLIATQGFDVVNKGSDVWLICLSSLQGLCGMTYGFFISTIANDATSAIMFGIGSYFPLMITCGFLWPTEAMPDFLQAMVQFLPLTLPNTAMIWILSHGKDIAFHAVWKGFLVTLSWSLAFVILSVLVMRYKK